uniref:Zinc fingers and homeoboxes protein 1 n=1 Tax=Knipowitschia caucasica TaxID=637954 RepID=A0AAV2K637_KNICA
MPPGDQTPQSGLSVRKIVKPRSWTGARIAILEAALRRETRTHHHRPLQHQIRLYCARRQPRSARRTPANFTMGALLWGLVLASVLTVHCVERHSLTYIYTALSKKVPNPGIHEFTAMGLLDTKMIDYFDSDQQKKIPKQPWMKDNLDPEYWSKGTQSRKSKQQWFNVNLGILKDRMNQSDTDLHVLQWMHGCEADLEPNGDLQFVRGIDQYSYNGDSFLYFDDYVGVWVAASKEAEQTKRKWDDVAVLKEYTKGYLEKECLEWLKKFMEFGKNQLIHAKRPDVYVFASPARNKDNVFLNCMATGFYPPDIVVQLKRDGLVLKDVHTTGIRPNQDDTYQRRDYIEILRTDEGPYICEVIHAATHVTIAKKWDGVLPPHSDDEAASLVPVIAGAVAVVVLLLVVGVVAVVIYMKHKRPVETGSNGSSKNSSSDNVAVGVPLLNSGSSGSSKNSSSDNVAVVPLLNSVLVGKLQKDEHRNSQDSAIGSNGSSKNSSSDNVGGVEVPLLNSVWSPGHICREESGANSEGRLQRPRLTPCSRKGWRLRGSDYCSAREDSSRLADRRYLIGGSRMSRRRKSSTPCMLPKQEVESEQEDLCSQSERSAVRGGGTRALDSDDDIMQADFVPSGAAGVSEGGYECKYCSFQTSDMNRFTDHVDSEHPHVVTNTSYVCVECDYSTKSYNSLQIHNSHCHPGEDCFTRTTVMRNNRTVVQQSINELSFCGGFVKSEEGRANTSPAHLQSEEGGALPAHLSPVKAESDSDEDYDSKEMPVLSPAPLTPVTSSRLASAPPPLVLNGSGVLQVKGASTGVLAPGTVAAGTLAPATLAPGTLAPGTLAPGTLAQVLTALQSVSSSPQTQLLIPLSSIPTYSPAMDNNVLLLSAYSRFPYPSLSEILGLSSQTKFSEEQIKVWFSAQRLKHGVSWTPEEVEEARRKKSNGSVQAPPTITVIPASLAPNGLQSLFQTCHIVGQPGLVLAQVPANANANGLPAAPPITLTLATPTHNHTSASEPNETQTRTETASGLDKSRTKTKADSGLDLSPNKPKKSKEQLAELKASYSRKQIASEGEISRLMEVTGLSKRAIKKWFSDTRYNQRNSKDQHGMPLTEAASRSGSGSRTRAEAEATGLSTGTIVIDLSDDLDSPSPENKSSEIKLKFRNAFPDFTLQKFKEKSVEQLQELEASYQKEHSPSDQELTRLRTSTKLTRREVEAWFNERRKATEAPPSPQDRPQQSATADTSAAAAAPGKGASGSRRAVKKTLAQLHVLKTAFVRSQWPSPQEYERLAAETGLPRSHIVTWYGDTRYAIKNNALKWYYLYQSGKGEEVLNGGKKKSRKRFRGWSRRRRTPSKRPAQEFNVKVKSGTWFLKDYYRRHRDLSETDLDDLVSKSGLSYERVRDWFKEVQRREAEGLQGFSDDPVTTEEEDMEEDEGENMEQGDPEQPQTSHSLPAEEGNSQSEAEEEGIDQFEAEEESNSQSEAEEGHSQSEPVAEQT